MPPKTSRVDDIDCLRLIYAGRVTQLQKRVWDFVPLVDHLLEAGVRFRFDVYGDGDQFEPLRDAMRRAIPAELRPFPRPRAPRRDGERVVESRRLHSDIRL